MAKLKAESGSVRREEGEKVSTRRCSDHRGPNRMERWDYLRWVWLRKGAGRREEGEEGVYKVEGEQKSKSKLEVAEGSSAPKGESPTDLGSCTLGGLCPQSILVSI